MVFKFEQYAAFDNPAVKIKADNIYKDIRFRKFFIRYLIRRGSIINPTVHAINVTAIIPTINLWCFLKNSIPFPLMLLLYIILSKKRKCNYLK